MTASNAPGFLENSIASPGTAAMMLALTQTIYDVMMRTWPKSWWRRKG